MTQSNVHMPTYPNHAQCEQALSCFMLDSQSGTASSLHAINATAGSLPLPYGPFAPNAEDDDHESNFHSVPVSCDQPQEFRDYGNN